MAVGRSKGTGARARRGAAPVGANVWRWGLLAATAATTGLLGVGGAFYFSDALRGSDAGWQAFRGAPPATVVPGVGAAAAAPDAANPNTPSPVHVCFCTDDTDLRGLVVAIQTAFASARQPRRLVFHVIVPQSLRDLFASLLSTYVGNGTGAAGAPRMEVYSSQALEVRIAAMVPSNVASKARRVLASPFNFVPFYLHDVFANGDKGLRVEKVLYLDTDVVVRGDLADIYDAPLGGAPVAAAEDCLQTADDVFNLNELQKHGAAFDPQECTLRRGVHVVNLTAWRAGRYAAKLERWLARARDAEDALWQTGLAEPAWMLVLNRSYTKIDPKFHCFNLGTPGMNLEQSTAVRQMGYDHKAIIYDLSIAVNGARGTMRPFFVSCSMSAHVLHFSGELKPWLVGVWRPTWKPPICMVPDTFKVPEGTRGPRWADRHDSKQMVVDCWQIWEAEILPNVSCALKDFEKEWIEEDQVWHDAWVKEQKDAKKKAAKAEKEQQELKKGGGQKQKPEGERQEGATEDEEAEDGFDVNLDEPSLVQ